MFGRTGPGLTVPEPDPPPPAPGDSEDDRVRAWRVEMLEGLGLPYPVALELAIEGADWQKVKVAVDRGASVDQVERIFL
jgi:hypothetical protein